MTINLQTVLDRLVLARNNAGLTQVQVAKMIGNHGNANLSKMENGERTLSLAVFLQLCEIYEVSPVWALSGINPDFDQSRFDAMIEQSNVIEEDAKKLRDLLESLQQGDTDTTPNNNVIAKRTIQKYHAEQERLKKLKGDNQKWT